MNYWHFISYDARFWRNYRPFFFWKMRLKLFWILAPICFRNRLNHCRIIYSTISLQHQLIHGARAPSHPQVFNRRGRLIVQLARSALMGFRVVIWWLVFFFFYFLNVVPYLLFHFSSGNEKTELNTILIFLKYQIFIRS